MGKLYNSFAMKQACPQVQRQRHIHKQPRPRLLDPPKRCASAQELTPRARDSLVSFGERLSTRLFAAHLRACGVHARQHDAFSSTFNLATSDDFGAAEVAYDAALPAVRTALAPPPGEPRCLPIVTGFLGRGVFTGAPLSRSLNIL